MKTIRFLLSPTECQLVLKQGYPFKEFKAALEAGKGNSESVAFELDSFYFEHLLGEIARSANHSTSRALDDRLGELYETLESVAADHGLAT